MADREQITLIKTQALARIAEITAQPKPDYQIDGQKVAWADYLMRLKATVDWCDSKTSEFDGPIELRSTGVA